MLHSPVETPKISSFGSFVSPGRETSIEIHPTVGMATPALANIEKEKRQCVYSAEKQLRFYRTYTQRNCIMECEANFTLMFCQCAMYYMPSTIYIFLSFKILFIIYIYIYLLYYLLHSIF
jgi:amiloride-sensitive sodium channel